MMDERILTGQQVQKKLGIDDRKLVDLYEYFSKRIEGFGAYVGRWRRYTEREVEIMRYFIRECKEFDVAAVISERAINLFLPQK